jgi:hypothetical protein
MGLARDTLYTHPRHCHSKGTVRRYYPNIFIPIPRARASHLLFCLRLAPAERASFPSVAKNTSSSIRS